jgi:hypothetical protein
MHAKLVGEGESFVRSLRANVASGDKMTICLIECQTLSFANQETPLKKLLVRSKVYCLLNLVAYGSHQSIARHCGKPTKSCGRDCE